MTFWNRGPKYEVGDHHALATNNVSTRKRLPIDLLRAEIIAKMHEHPVVVVNGEVGCGKSTRLPQFLLGEYPHCSAAVGIPRALPAKSLPRRTAQELGQPLREGVGFSTGRGRRLPSSDAGSTVYATYLTLWKRLRYGARGLSYCICDEIHERSIEMDMGLFILRAILEENISESRFDFRVVLTSATIDEARLCDYFNAPKSAVIQVPGRCHHVDR